MVGSPLARALSRLHLPISVKSCRSRRYCGLADSPVLLNVDVHGSSQIGGAKPLVICHGLFGCRHNFRSIALALATRLRTRVYCVDMRNHGDSPWSDHMDYASMAADLKLTIEEHIFRRAQIDKINLVGHSMGGRAVMELALHHIEARQFIDKIVIEDVAPRPPPSPTDIPSYISFMLQLERDLWQFDRLSQARAFCDTELKKVVPELAVRQFLLTNLIEEPSGAIAWRVNLRAIESSLDKLLGMDLNPNNLSACLRPTMVVYGAKSDYVTPSDMDQYTHLFPNIQFECIPGAGHWVHADNPNLFLGVLTDCIMFGAEFDEQLRVPIEFPGTSDAQVPLYVAAPMVRYSRLTFRRLCRGYNTDVCCTPMIMADSFTRSDKCRKVEWVTEPGDRPLIAQFAANDGKMLADAAELVAGQCDGIDLNCGCPQRWVMAEGYGSCLLKQPDLIADMVSQTRNRLASLAPKVTVSIKIRLALGGLESTVDLCRKTQMAGVDFITIHGRTPKQRCEPVDYDSIATVIRSLEIPVILNGDVTNQVDAQKLAQKTGARGVMAARGLLHNPAMFAGYAVAPETCIKDWVETGIRDGLTFASWHQHLIFMLEKQLRKSDRKVFNALQSFGECIDFLNENLGLGCDWPSLQSLRLSKCSDESGENE